MVFNQKYTGRYRLVGHGSDPIPLTNEEVRRMGIEKVLVSIDVSVGDTVKVTDGPFDNFMGVIEEINMEKQIMKVRISMFGRETPVELEFGEGWKKFRKQFFSYRLRICRLGT